MVIAFGNCFKDCAVRMFAVVFGRKQTN